ncbi:hypothetical protein Tco_0269065 [Tanacetum coccineum]
MLATPSPRSECMTRSSTKDLLIPFEEPERVFHSTRKLFKTPSLDYSSSPKFNLFFDHEDQSEEEVAKEMGEPTIKEYMMKTREDYGSKIARPKFDDKTHFELKEQFLKELRDNTFSGSKNEDANEHIEKVLEIVDLFHIPDDCPLKEEGKTLEEAYYTQFGVPFPQGGRYKAAALVFYQRDSGNPSYQERRQTMEESLSKFMGESTNRHDENSNLIKEIQAVTDAAIRNQGASIKALEIQIGQMSKVLQERGSGSLPSLTETNLRDHVKSISTTVETETPSIRLGELSPTKLIIELADRTIKRPKGIVENVLVAVENMKAYQDQDMGEVIVRKSFCKASCVKARWFDRVITIYNGNDSVTYQMARSHPRFKHLTNEQCNKMRPLLKTVDTAYPTSMDNA